MQTMDLGNLVVDLVSLVIIMSVFTLAVVRKDTRAAVKRRSVSESLAERGYYGSNPAEGEEDPSRL